jgi:hypothetical protein
LSLAKCVRVNVCQLPSVKFQRFPDAVSTLSDAGFRLTVELPSSLLVARPSLIITALHTVPSFELDRVGSGRKELVLRTSGSTDIFGEGIAELSVDGHQCFSRDFTATCDAGYHASGQRCKRVPAQALCASAKVHAAKAEHALAQFMAIGTSLHVALDRAAFDFCQLRLTPIFYATSAYAVGKGMNLETTGRFAVHGHCAQQPACKFDQFGPILLQCPSTHVEVGNRCRPKLNSGCPPGFAFEDDRCKRLPLVRLASTDAIYEQLHKVRDSSFKILNSTVNVDGDFVLNWTVTCPQEGWIECSPARGLLGPNNRVAIISTLLNATGKSDSSVTNTDLRGVITMQSAVPGHTHEHDLNGGFDGQTSRVELRVQVIADCYLTEEDVTLWVTGERTPIRPFGTSKAPQVLWKSLPLEVRVAAYDCERLEVLRPVSFEIWQSSSPGTKILLTRRRPEDNVYVAQLSAEFFDVGSATYTLLLSSPEGAVRILQFELEVTTTMLATFIVVGAIGTGLLALAIILFRLSRRHQGRLKSLFWSFLQYELLLAAELALEVWDITSTPGPRPRPRLRTHS